MDTSSGPAELQSTQHVAHVTSRDQSIDSSEYAPNPATSTDVSSKTTEKVEPSVQFATFWRRTAAILIDILILVLVEILIFEPVLGYLGLRSEKDVSTLKVPFAVAVMLSYTATTVIFILLDWLYFALQESGPRQATFGKRILNIAVTTASGSTISFGQATSRFFGKFVSAILFFGGFLMIAFDKEKRGLHDLLADTRVVARGKVVTIGDTSVKEKAQDLVDRTRAMAGSQAVVSG